MSQKLYVPFVAKDGSAMMRHLSGQSHKTQLIGIFHFQFIVAMNATELEILFVSLK
jgi:hypothetical protein